MRTRKIAAIYQIDREAFESFLIKNNLEFTTGVSMGIRDDLVDGYVAMYKRMTSATDKEAKKNPVSIDRYNANLDQPKNGAVYSVNGVRGRHIDVFENKCIITTKVTIGSILSHNATDGEKTIYYSDVVGVQFKEPGLTIGYLQLETPGLTMNNAASNFFNENSFTFDTSVIETEKMREIAAYIESRVQAIKHPQPQPQAPVQTVAQFSVADELLKFKQLLDMGAITQQEFDAKKKELLNL